MKPVLIILCLVLGMGWSAPTAQAQSADTVMKTYRDTKGTSNVSGYGTGRTWIIVQFKDGSMYLYNNKTTGADHVREMKRLAAQGEGLNAYINANVRKNYAEKLR